MSANLTIDATFENGVFVPRRPVRSIAEHQEVKLNIEVPATNKTRPLSEAFFADESIPAPFDLPHYGESRLVEVVRGGEREIDPAALTELTRLQCTSE